MYVISKVAIFYKLGHTNKCVVNKEIGVIDFDLKHYKIQIVAPNLIIKCKRCGGRYPTCIYCVQGPRILSCKTLAIEQNLK